jgi:hypothetical protein
MLLPGSDSVVSIASRMSWPARDNWWQQCDRYRTWTHDQLTAGNFRLITMPNRNCEQRGQLYRHLRAYLPVRVAMGRGRPAREVAREPLR